jgi:hypothetical protein
MIIPLVALASLVVAAFVIIPGHRSALPTSVQMAATKVGEYDLRLDHSAMLRANAPCHSKRERYDKGRCA